MGNKADSTRDVMKYIVNTYTFGEDIHIKTLPAEHQRHHFRLKLAGYLKLKSRNLKTGEYVYTLTREGKYFGDKQ